MSDLFHPIDSKFKHTQSLITELGGLITNSSFDNLFKLKVEFKENRLGYRLIVEKIDFSQLKDWGLRAGDCLVNLRSVLDNLVYALALLKKNPPNNARCIYFPICKSQEEFGKKAAQCLSQLPENVAIVL